ncbi:MAG TPA: ATP-binding protein [Phormidium sp.]
MPTQVFGNFTDNIPNSKEYLTISFSPDSSPRKQRWRNYGLSADFLGDYFAAFFPGDTAPDSKINQRNTVKAAVSFIANEFLENAVKYNDDLAQLPISISLHLYEQQIIFHIVNYPSEAAANQYQKFIQELTEANLEDYYIEQLERTAAGEDISGMGILTMMNDYSAHFGWKFQVLKQQPTIVQVDVLAYLNL